MKTYAEIRTATPELVNYLLSLNTKNRDVKPRVVDKYSLDIRNGNWKLSNQGIGVTKDDVLADGQHRLEAIKACGYPPVEILIVYGLDNDVQLVVDAHAKRSARDLLHFAFDYRVSRVAPACANVLMKHEQNKWFGGFTNHELMDCLGKYQDELSLVTSTPNKCNFFAAPFFAGFCWVMKNEPERRDDICAFMRRVEAGEMLDKTMPEYHLRNFIASSTKIKGGGEMQKERYYKTIKACKFSLSGQLMGVLRV